MYINKHIIPVFGGVYHAPCRRKYKSLIGTKKKRAQGTSPHARSRWRSSGRFSRIPGPPPAVRKWSLFGVGNAGKLRVVGIMRLYYRLLF